MNQDQLQLNNPKHICKRFIIFVLGDLWSHGNISNAFICREKGKKKSSKDDKKSKKSSTEADESFDESGPAPKTQSKNPEMPQEDNASEVPQSKRYFTIVIKITF